MKINTLTEVKDVEVTTLTLIENQTGTWVLWKCPICGNPLFRFKGRVVEIEPGEVPTEIPVLLQCSNSRCQHNYLLRKFISRKIFL